MNVCTGEVQEGIDVAIAEGRIAYLGTADHCVGEGTRIIDAEGQCIAPGFLDGHIHVESSMMGAGEYARAVVPHGTTGIYWDPHEVCNVLGLDGVRLMAEDARRTPLKAMITTPSCVPAVPGFEDTGSSIGPEDIAETMNWQNVVGLGEMMNFPGILSGADHAHGEVAETLRAGKTATGHYSLPETDRGLNAYIASGVRCCHESTRPEDALAKMRLGMYAQLRFGSAWQDLPVLAEAVASGGIDTRFANLVSDDTHPHTLVADGHLDHIVRTAVSLGIDAVSAIQMVTINCAQCFQMDHDLGSITPGKCADIVFLDDLESLRVTRVLIDGEVVAEDGRALFDLPPYRYPDWATRSVHLGREIARHRSRWPPPRASSTVTPCACARSRSFPERWARSKRTWTSRLRTAAWSPPWSRTCSRRSCSSGTARRAPSARDSSKASASSAARWPPPWRTTRTTCSCWAPTTRTWPWPRTRSPHAAAAWSWSPTARFWALWSFPSPASWTRSPPRR